MKLKKDLEYNIHFDKQTIKFLDKLNSKIRNQILKKIFLTKKEPRRFFQRLTDIKSYKLRVGEYRVIADIDKNKQEITILFIEHRKKVYKEFT